MFKKKKLQKTENISVNSDSIFPNAKDTLEISSKKWRTITPKEILEKIKYESSKGNREATFYDCYISDELVKELKNQGYKVVVNSSPDSMGPYFKVLW